MVEVEWAARTNVGGRANNQDAWFATRPVWAVADGMGGHAAGEVASRMAVDALRDLGGRPVVTEQQLVDAIAAAEQAIAEAGRPHGGRGMGTTLTGIALVAGEDRDAVVVFNVGDSRVYRSRGHDLVQLTHDHSLVQELVDRGDITSEAARTHPRRNMITRSLGTGGTLEIDCRIELLRNGDRFLVCSDGLTNELTDDEIADHLAYGTPAAAANALIADALDAGGHDNVTVVVVDIDAVGPIGGFDDPDRTVASRTITPTPDR